MPLQLSDAVRTTAGVVLLAVVTIEFGGWYLLRVVRGHVEMTAFQRAFARAGHAHAGVLVTLGLVTLLLSEAVELSGAVGWLASSGVAVSAILVSGGFLAASAGRDVHEPNRAIVILYAGAALLAASTLTLGWALVTA